MKFIQNFDYKTLVLAIITIVLGIFAELVLKKVFTGFAEKIVPTDKINKKRQTYVKLVNNTIKYVLIFVVIMIILELYGINITSILAGLGIVSLIAGLALQDALKDIIMGINLIFDEYFEVGNIVKMGDIEGKFVSIGLKVTKIIDINNGNTYVIANRNIGDAITVGSKFDYDITVPETTTDFDSIIKNDIIKQIDKLPNVIKVEYLGIENFNSNSVCYKIRINTKPEVKDTLRRKVNEIVRNIMKENNIDKL